jgi:hypothetical protein
MVDQTSLLHSSMVLDAKRVARTASACEKDAPPTVLRRDSQSR